MFDGNLVGESVVDERNFPLTQFDLILYVQMPLSLLPTRTKEMSKVIGKVTD